MIWRKITTGAVIHPCRTSSPADMAERRQTFCTACWFFTGPTCCYRSHVAHSTCLPGCMSFSTRVSHPCNPTCSKAAVKVSGLEVNTLKLSVNLRTSCQRYFSKVKMRWCPTTSPSAADLLCTRYCFGVKSRAALRWQQWRKLKTSREHNLLVGTAFH